MNIQNYIGGEFSSVDNHIPIHNPSNGVLLGEAPDSEEHVVSLAIDAAKQAQPSWAKRTMIDRAGFLVKLASLIRRDAESLAQYLIEEQGKTQTLAATEVAFSADYLDYMASFARQLEGEVLPSDRPNEFITLTYKPVGVVGAILPWNFPFFLIVRKLAPALLTGNTVVMKPSEETPLNAAAFCALVEEAGLPAGVFNMVFGTGATVGAAITSSPHVNLISMTGSVNTGKKIMAAAAENLTRVNLELGGKAPAIVLEDADLDLAADAIWNSRIINTGQVCNCAEVVLVQKSVHKEFVSKLVDKFNSTKYGDTSAAAALDMGPLINSAALSRVKAFVEEAVQEGADVLCGGERDQTLPEGYFFKPTILDNVKKGSAITRQEVFGPVLPIVVVEDLDEALEFANSSDYGLTSSVYTENLHHAMKAARELQYGETYINRENFEAMQGFHAGRRNSGIGGADGKHGLLEYVETHVVYTESKL